MPTYTADFEYSLHTSQRVTHKLVVVEEETNAAERLALLHIYIERENSGREHDANRQAVQIKINDEIVYDGQLVNKVLGENSSDIVEIQPNRNESCFKVYYNSDGTKDIKIEVTYKSEAVSLLLTTVWGTTATAELSFSLTPIDVSPPVISDISISADRYGKNAFVRFKVSHSSYDLKEVEFKLNGMTEQQAKCRDLWYDKIRAGEIDNPPTYTNQNWNGKNDAGDWYVRLIRVHPIGKEVELYYPLDDVIDHLHPFDSGKSYPYQITAVSFNMAETEVEGYLKVPQKVTDITCENQLGISVGQSTTLEYVVFPDNAEEKSVKFKSSDENVATVDEYGVITAVSDGPCIITVTTVDGNFQASCVVNVVNSNVFANLEHLERYFTVNYFNRMIFSTSFIRKELIEKSIAVSELETISLKGRNEPVKNILPALQSFRRNCLTLKNAAEESGIDCSSLPDIVDLSKKNSGWIFVFNTWIDFLNELHQRINGG